ncbi:hypothetical protein MMC14_004439 [Varicellaria rhodocarpa]|nr:hypothetical protein [Varicellaria rhodocarpa]
MALAEAARNGHIEIVRKLLSIRDYRQMDLQDVLIAALSSCNEAVMEALISYVARMPKFEWPSELLCRLSQFGLGTEIEKVLSSAALLETALTIRNRTPLYEVARQGHLEVLKIILKNKNSLTEKSDTDGRTPLHSACARGHATTAQLLLDSGADCNAVDDYEHNALIIACFNGQHEVVKVLTKAGCNVNYRKEDEWPPLFITGGETTLHRAIRRGDLDLAEFLIERSAAINAINSNGDSALQMTVYKGRKDIVACLLDHDANIDHTNIQGITPVFKAARSNSAQTMQLLIDRGANFYHRDNDG